MLFSGLQSNWDKHHLVLELPSHNWFQPTSAVPLKLYIVFSGTLSAAQEHSSRQTGLEQYIIIPYFRQITSQLRQLFPMYEREGFFSHVQVGTSHRSKLHWFTYKNRSAKCGAAFLHLDRRSLTKEKLFLHLAAKRCVSSGTLI